MTNLEQLRDSVRTRIGLPSADAFYTDPVVNDLVNEAIQQISLEADWPWLQASATLTTVLNQQAYTPPVATGHLWLRTRGITPTDDSNSLDWKPLLQIRNLGTISGDPQVYCISGEQIVLGPRPGSVRTYTHDYIRQEPVLFQNEAQPLLPVPFRPAIVHLAAAMAHLRQNAVERYDMEMRSYNAALKRMMDNRRRSTAPAQVRIRPGTGLDIF